MGGMENKSEFFFLFYSFIFLDFVNIRVHDFFIVWKNS